MGALHRLFAYSSATLPQRYRFLGNTRVRALAVVVVVAGSGGAACDDGSGIRPLSKSLP